MLTASLGAATRGASVRFSPWAAPRLELRDAGTEKCVRALGAEPCQERTSVSRQTVAEPKNGIKETPSAPSPRLLTGPLSVLIA